MRSEIALILLLATGCGGGGGSAPGPLPETPAVVAQAVIPQAAPFAVVGDSISAGYNAGTAYVTDFSRAWPATASVIVGRPVTNTSIYGGQEPSMATNEVPLIPSNATTVVYEGGTNDVADTAAPDDASLVARIDDMIANIHAQAPKAAVVLVTVRIFSGITSDETMPVYSWPHGSDVYHRIMVWNAHERSLGLPLIDLQNVSTTDASAYPDGVHPSPAQVQTLAQLVANVLR